MKTAAQVFEEEFDKAFVKKADKPPETDEKKPVQGKQEVGEDPGEGSSSNWSGTDPVQISPDVRARELDTRDGTLKRVFKTPPSPRGKERMQKTSHTRRLTMREQLQKITWLR